ncbi:MAG: FHA domain-containing protein [Gammaproteobacteria bacterium]
MAARLDSATAYPTAVSGEKPAGKLQLGDSAGLAAGLAYVGRCLRGHRPFGIITGSGTSLEPLLQRVTADCLARDDLHTARIDTPTDSVHAFLTNVLGELGFDLHLSALDDLHNLLVVFLRHESARGRRTVVIIDDTEHFGPRVLEHLQVLSSVRAGTTPGITFILAGSTGLNRILDSRGMAGLRQFTRERYDLDRSLAWVATRSRPPVVNIAPGPGSAGEPGTPALQPHPNRTLLVMLDGTISSRHSLAPGRLIIGRSSQSGLCLESRYVSRQHAALLVSAGDVVVIDLGSTNATLVNGEAVMEQRLEHGDVLAIGNFRLRFDTR